MRAPLRGDDYFCRQVNGAAEKVQKVYLEAIKPAIAMHQANAMLGDGTVTQADTFEPREVQNLYQQLANTLEDWTFSGVIKSGAEDLQRIYSQFTKEADKFYISGYFGIQFHVLPYYRVDRRLLEIQKELAKISDKTTSVLSTMTRNADRALADELEKRGYSNLEFEELFAKVFDDEKLVEVLDQKAAAVESQFGLEKTYNEKNKLFSELNDLIMKLYQTLPVLIDYNRLMQGEEGVVNYFDIEVIKNKKMRRREAFLDTTKMTKAAADAVAAELGQVADALSKITR
ncbi:MAG: hypothetical protein M3239_01400 [Thermoproteota archaeon]|nr:hypothetical protein [Thermoproteota archaeon]